MIAYALTDDAAEGTKAKNIALNSTIALVLEGQHVFVLTDVNTRTGKEERVAEK